MGSLLRKSTKCNAKNKKNKMNVLSVFDSIKLSRQMLVYFAGHKSIVTTVVGQINRETCLIALIDFSRIYSKWSEDSGLHSTRGGKGLGSNMVERTNSYLNASIHTI